MGVGSGAVGSVSVITIDYRARWCLVSVGWLLLTIEWRYLLSWFFFSLKLYLPMSIVDVMPILNILDRLLIIIITIECVRAWVGIVSHRWHI